MKTKTEIIEETYEYYKIHPQAINKNGGCSYLTEEGHMCAVGRCMTDEVVAFQKENMDEGAGGCKTPLNDFRFHSGICSYVDLDQFLRPEYHGHSTDFWRELQKFHDDNLWKDGQINISGQEDYKNLLERWQDEEQRRNHC